jgi:UDP-N-acetylmuramate--alanine ligase
MHIYFSGIGGAGIGPLAQVALQAGHQVSGSDKQMSQYIEYLKKHGIKDITIGQTQKEIATVHEKNPIDWFVYSSALTLENPDASELKYCKKQKIKTSKRDEFLNSLIKENDLKLIAIAGTHGKTTTTALVVWLFTELRIPISYILPAKVSFGDMGRFEQSADYFVYEADEFDHNFLSFTPYLSLITGVSWDHHEIFPTRENYKEAFREFISQSNRTLIWGDDYDYLGLDGTPANLLIQNADNPLIATLALKGRFNRLDAWLALTAVHRVTNEPLAKLISIVNRFPGLSRRMEAIAPNLYSDYAHTPEKIRGAMSVASELAAEHNQNVVVVYEPLTNRRQHFMIDEYKDCFVGASIVYWLPSYKAREDPRQRIIEPAELIERLSDPGLAKPAQRDKKLKNLIEEHLKNNDMVIAMNGSGGGDGLDEWLRREFR